MPLVSIPLKVKGMKRLENQLAFVIDLIIELTDRQDTILTVIDDLNARLDNIAADIAGLKQAVVDKAAADAATIATLQEELAAALAAGDPAAVQAAVDAAVANAQAGFEASLQPVLDKAAAIDEQTPPVEPAPVV